MKHLVMVSLFFWASVAGAQSAPKAMASLFSAGVSDSVNGCGPAKTAMQVTATNKAVPLAKPGPAKSAIYFLQDDQFYRKRPRPTLLWGVDGTWVGATHGDTYFYVLVDPGERLVCAAWQSSGWYVPGNKIASAQFTAVAGETYYLRAQDIYPDARRSLSLQLDHINPNDAAVLMQHFGFTTSSPKE